MIGPGPMPGGRAGEKDDALLLSRLPGGDRVVAEELMPLVYSRLRGLARRAMNGERTDHTLQATALVHEAFVRLIEGGRFPINDRNHFFSLMSRLMRQVLVDHARKLKTARRGAGASRVPLNLIELEDQSPTLGLLLLDKALTELEQVDCRQARVIELRFFAGLDVTETARLLEVSVPTVVVDTRIAKAWLSAWIGDHSLI